MNSLQDLNNYSAIGISYPDQRIAQFVLQNITTANVVTSVNEGATHTVALGNDLYDIVGYVNGNISYKIDLTDAPNANLTWGNTSGLTVSNVGNIRMVSNIQTLSDWNRVKQPSITMPRDYAGTYYYSANLFSTSNSMSWTNTVNVVDSLEISTPISQVYSNVSVTTFTNYPQILDSENDGSGTYTITIRSSDNSVFGNLTTNGSSGTSTFASNVLTLTGTRSQVNSRLSNLKFYPVNNNISRDWTATYSLTNPVSGLVSNVTQKIVANANTIFGSVDDGYYDEDLVGKITGPKIIDVYGNGTGTYTANIFTGVTANSVISLSSANAWGGSSSFTQLTASDGWYNAGSKSAHNGYLTITGNLAQVNGHLANITLAPEIDYVNPIILKYTATTPSANTAIKLQTLNIRNQNTEISSNISLSRSYTRNQISKPFEYDTPIILETANTFPGGDGVSSYTIGFRSDVGIFGSPSKVLDVFGGANWRAGINNKSADFSFSGSKSECNAVIANLKFYPSPGISSNGTFDFTMSRNNGYIMLTQSGIPMLGSAGDGVIPGSETITITSSGNLTISDYQLLYLKADLLLVGGGGASGYAGPDNNNTSPNPVRWGGGGAGGNVKIVSNINLSNVAISTTFYVTVGAGGAAPTTAANAASGGWTLLQGTPPNGSFGNIFTVSGGGGAYKDPTTNANTASGYGGKTAGHLGGYQYQLSSHGSGYIAAAPGGAGASDWLSPTDSPSAFGFIARSFPVFSYAQKWDAYDGWSDTAITNGFVPSTWANANVLIGGCGGPAVVSTITGNAVGYGGGGAGYAFKRAITTGFNDGKQVDIAINGQPNALSFRADYNYNADLGASGNVTFTQFEAYGGYVSTYFGGGGGQAANLLAFGGNTIPFTSNAALGLNVMSHWTAIKGENGVDGKGGGAGAPNAQGGDGIVIIKFHT